jgi:hypothetical protein
LGTYAVKGIITFALGGVLLIFAVMFLQLFFTRYPSDVGNVINGLPLAFVGFLLVGLGIWGIVKDASGSRPK